MSTSLLYHAFGIRGYDYFYCNRFLTLWAVGCYNYSHGEEIAHMERRSPCRSWINPKPRHS